MNSFHARKPKGKTVPHEKKAGPALTPPHIHGHQVRADILLVKLGLALSRSAAQALIDAGQVTAQLHGKDEPVAKSSQLLPEHTPLRIHGPVAEKENP
jgi:23S rRNA (cytidine1920-2'-O)/16S rRNA (cytidine1409-2'-O)-methyltransferase